jgi:5-methylcytosine-specific restriction endonuclease McrA
MMMGIKTECAVCGKVIYRTVRAIVQSKSGKNFCSLECFGKFCKKKEWSGVICSICGKEFTKLKSRQKYCSRGCANRGRIGVKYRTGARKSNYKHKEDQKRSLIEERGPICEVCGYNNMRILQVHHIKEKKNGGTDELTNLQLLCPNCHFTIHYGK